MITVAFNSAETISYQIRTIRRFMKGSYNYFVFDNSTDEKEAEQISILCRQDGVNYIRLPHNPYRGHGHGSVSHGVALNYAWKHYLSKRDGRNWIGIIDHDIFLVNPIDMDSVLENHKLYGRMMTYGKHDYMWPGLFFCKENYLMKKGYIDFKPGRGVDTGGNVLTIDDIEKCKVAVPKLIPVNTGCQDQMGRSNYELYDETWLHFGDLSNFANFDGLSNKKKEIWKLLEEKAALEGCEAGNDR